MSRGLRCSRQGLLLALLFALTTTAACIGDEPDDPIAADTEATSELALAGAPVRALILIDSRLYAELSAEVDEYRALAERRRGFSIGLKVVTGLDDWSYGTVKDYVIGQRAANTAIEGVLFIGNVKLPSFYKTRNDVVLNRIYASYYEDLDGSFSKHYADGAIDPVCDPGNDPWCVVSPRLNGDGPQTVPVHDLDNWSKGPNPGPEIWASFMPVGRDTGNTYPDFAAQLRPYLKKVISFYKLKLATNGRYYLVGNDKGETFDLIWSAFGRSKIDFYGKPGPNGETEGACLQGGQNLCYQRWPTETYASAQAFLDDYAAKPWVGEGWQSQDIFTQHMNAQRYDVAEVNVHSEDDNSLLFASQARALTKSGLIVALDGCAVASFAQPGSPSTVDHPWTSVDDNIAASYLYGAASTLAVLGAPHWRGHYSHYPTMYKALKTDRAYLGRAHFVRMQRQYDLAGADPYNLKEQGGEMLLGDPFMDLGWYDGFDGGSARWSTSGGAWSIVSDGGKVYEQRTLAGTARAVAGESSWTNQRLQASVKITARDGADAVVALLGRYRDSSNFYQLALRLSSLELRKRSGATWTILATAPVSFATGSWSTIRLEVVGSTLRAYVNGSKKLEITDADHPFASGRVGLSTYNATARFDKVSVAP